MAKQKKPGYTAAQKLAVEHYTSNADDCFKKFKTFDKFMEHIDKKGADGYALMWQPFENFTAVQLGEGIADLAADIHHLVQAAVKGVVQSVCAVLVVEESQYKDAE